MSPFMDNVKLVCRGKMFHWHFTEQHHQSWHVIKLFFSTVKSRPKKKKKNVVRIICINSSYWVDSAGCIVIVTTASPNDAILLECDNSVAVTSAINKKHSIFTYIQS